MDKLDQILYIQDDSKRQFTLVQYIKILEKKVQLLDDALDLSSRIEKFNDELVERNNYLEQENVRLLLALNQKQERINNE